MEGPFFEKVGLLEDDQSHALLISRALKDFAGEVVVAGTLHEALQKFPAACVRLIVSDLHLPDTDGVGFIEKLVAAGGNIPLIVLTSSARLQDAVEAMKRGAHDYLLKSFDDQFKESLFLALSRVYAASLLEQERTRLRHQMEVLRLAVENSPDGLAVANSSGEVVYANRAFGLFLRRCGAEGENLLSTAFPQAKKGQALAQAFSNYFSTLTPGAVWDTEVALSDGTHSAYEMSLSVIQPGDKAGDAERIIWVRDATEQNRREHFQREVLSTTTHDLRGPLGAILISAELLSGMLKGQDKSSEMALRINSSARGALNLIDEFLSARRIQEGTFVLRPALYNLRDLLSGVVENYRTIAAARKITLTVEDGGDALDARVDKLGFERVAGNLLSNALKFTGKVGKVWVRMIKRPDEFCLQVQDTGSGMEPSDIKKVFERFTRLERHSDIAGTGLGLFVVKSIVNAHGGRIEVESKLGEGTTFTVTFPASPPVNERGELISLDFA